MKKKLWLNLVLTIFCLLIFGHSITAKEANNYGSCYDENTKTWVNCNEDTPPTISVWPPSGNFTDASALVHISAIDDKDANPMIYVTWDGSIPTTSSSTSFANSGNIYFNTAETITVIAVDKMGNVSAPQIYTYTFDQNKFH